MQGKKSETSGVCTLLVLHRTSLYSLYITRTEGCANKDTICILKKTSTPHIAMHSHSGDALCVYVSALTLMVIHTTVKN